MLKDIRSQTAEELLAQFQTWDQPAYRVSQVLDWLYHRRVSDWEAMTNLPRALRERLREQFTLQSPSLVRRQGSRDTTEKYLWRLRDDALIESVLIPANPALYGEASDRHTLCVSTQVGCAYGCKFCASGLNGWRRNLEPDEIVNQVIAVEQSPAAAPAVPAEPKTSATDSRLVGNLVIMGMGEPLANYANLMQALRILNAPWGGKIGARKITISTSGLAPQIRQWADEPIQFRLALSLHGATDEVRNRLMPINRNRPPLRPYPGALAALARRLHAKINLIPYNRVEGLAWERPTQEAQERFLTALEREKASVTLRREKGHDIDAACGQLRLRELNQLPV